ncbi:RNA-binding protein 28-like [Penaeus monodon]|uniref:RNA-binding protein 28-like n=1 Tax=Penaeus monodon TaxID=6687 RepID=UPI0018A79B4B|nr:RNA-binding protein 28-like [Penaeus monodon]XP_037788400.1 RNA-binding protein 28-like [Penaeus monodon]
MEGTVKRLSMRPRTVTVVVRNLPPATTSDQLRSICHDFGEVVEVEIPQRAANYQHFIYGFVRYSSLDVALNAVLKLNTLVVQGRQLNAEVARKHWRNTNDKTVLYDAPQEDRQKERDEDELKEEEMNTRILQMCHQQWQQHCRDNRGRNLPSFHKLMDMLTEAFNQDGDETDTEAESYSQKQNADEESLMY